MSSRPLFCLRRTIAVAAVFASVIATAAPAGPLRGLGLAEALQRLAAAGAPLVWSDSLVRGTMRVDAEPRGATLRETAVELLRPHGLAVEDGPGGRWIVVAATSPPPLPDLVPEVAPKGFVVREEIVVHPLADFPGAAEAGAHSLDADDARSLPHLGDDVLRAVTFLPGADASEASSRVRIHGGRDDELLILLDGVELREPFHLADFDSALSIVSSTSLERVDLQAGGFSAKHGDRMGGVLDMRTVAPSGPSRFGVGLGLLFGEASGAGGFAGDRGSWLAVGRAGNYRLALEVEERPADPRFWDLLGKAGFRLRDGHELRLGVLGSGDDFALGEDAAAGISYGNRGESRYAWLAHDGMLGRGLAVATVASFARFERDRDGEVDEPGRRFALRDARTTESLALEEDWSLKLGERWGLRWGFDARREEAILDYRNVRRLEGPLAAIRSAPPSGETAFSGRIDGDRLGAYASAGARPRTGLDLELGLRYDRPAARTDSLLSPRFNAAWAVRDGDVVRAAWGWFHQSQRPDELEIEDGETALARPERAEHRMLGFEHRFGWGDTVRIDAYERRIRHPRRRFENLFDPIGFFPELAEDRVEIAPDRARSRGVDLLWRGADRGPLSWWLAYAFADVADDLAGRWVPRAVDGRHALQADVGYRFGGGWTANLAWTFHTGWPTTAVGGRVVPGPDGELEVEPVLGPLRAERLRAYHRLDLRVSRAWTLSRGKLSAYLDLQNLYDRENVRGFTDFAFDVGADGAVRVSREPESWGGFLPSFGIRWET